MRVTHDFTSQIKYLQERGLEVRHISPDRLSCTRANNATVELSWSPDGFFVACGDAIPGPGINDFALLYPSIDEALLVIWSFYFAVPVVIGDWRFPLAQRPFWALPRVFFRLSESVRISRDRFEGIQADRINRAATRFGKPASPVHLAEMPHFLTCEHIQDKNLQLMMRRDLKERYIVQDS